MSSHAILGRTTGDFDMHECGLSDRQGAGWQVAVLSGLTVTELHALSQHEVEDTSHW